MNQVLTLSASVGRAPSSIDISREIPVKCLRFHDDVPLQVMMLAPLSQRERMTASSYRQAYLLLATIVFAWGGNYPLMRLAINDMPPLAFTAVRVFGAAGILVFVVLTTSGYRELLPAHGERVPLAVVGLLQIATMLSLTIIGLVSVPPGRTVVLVYTMQLWAVPVGVWLLRERVGPTKLIGTSVGFAGLVTFLGPSASDWGDGRILRGSGLILMGAVAWALGSCMYRRRSWRTSYVSQTLWQLAVSIIPLILLSLAFERQAQFRPTLRLAVIMLFNWFVVTAFGMWAWAKILSTMPASTAGQFLLLTPIVGFALSAGLFGEQITSRVIASAAFICIGILLTMRGEALEPKNSCTR